MMLAGGMMGAGGAQPAAAAPLWLDAQPGVTIPNCPKGLEPLVGLDKLFVKQSIDVIEAFTDYKQANKYQILSAQGLQVFRALESPEGCCHRQCCCSNRAFEMSLSNARNEEILHLSRPFVCQCCCACCCLHEITVSCHGEVLGKVVQAGGCKASRLEVSGASDQVIFLVDGDWCYCCEHFQSKEFQILSAKDGETVVGKISKIWAGLPQEYFTNADNFGVSFPLDLDVKMKATLLGAVFLLDFVLFEGESPYRQHRSY